MVYAILKIVFADLQFNREKREEMTKKSSDDVKTLARFEELLRSYKNYTRSCSDLAGCPIGIAIVRSFLLNSLKSERNLILSDRILVALAGVLATLTMANMIADTIPPSDSVEPEERKAILDKVKEKAVLSVAEWVVSGPFFRILRIKKTQKLLWQLV